MSNPTGEALLARIKELEEALRKIADEYGPNHLSKYCHDIARKALNGH